jgi:tryptophan halogenase
VTLANGQKVEGDFFIDCTGFKSLLIGKTLRVENVDWSSYLPCDRAVVCKTENKGPLLPYTRATAQPPAGAGVFRCSSASATVMCTPVAS